MSHDEPRKPMDAESLAAYAEAALDELMASHPVANRPTIAWRKLRVTAGIAHYRDNRIALSLSLLTDESRVRTTLVHEYAHLLAVERHGKGAANHGMAWRQAMRDLGAVPERTHRYEVQRNLARQKVTYRCRKCGATFDRTRQLSRKHQYVHASCGGGLQLVAVDRTIALNLP